MYKNKLSPGEASAEHGAHCGAAICQHSFLPAHTSRLPSLHTELSSLLVVLFLQWFRLAKANAHFPEAEMPLALGLPGRKGLQQESSSSYPSCFVPSLLVQCLGNYKGTVLFPELSYLVDMVLSWGQEGVCLWDGGHKSQGGTTLVKILLFLEKKL